MVQVIDDIDHLRPGLRFVATVGVFDGVHLGHAHVLERLRELAAELDAAPVAITFDPHPQAVITGRAPDLICDPREKLSRMADAGAAVIVVQRFDEAFRAQTAEAFLARLARGRDLAGLVMSHESAFGRDRQGTVDAVRRLAGRDGFRLVEADTLEVDGAPVSSSRIRVAVAAGDLGAAERLLGRRYAVTGTVACDAASRWTLTPDDPVVLPPAGAYAVKASWHVADPDDVMPEAHARGAIPDAIDPLRPEQLGLGSAMIDAVEPIGLDVAPAPLRVRGDIARLQFVGILDEAAPSAGTARSVLGGAREGSVAIRAVDGERPVLGPIGSGRSDADSSPSSVYEARWDLAGTPSGLSACCHPAFASVDDALEWARGRATRIAVAMRVPPSGGADAVVVEWSAGDDPIDGLPRWDGRRPAGG